MLTLSIEKSYFLIRWCKNWLAPQKKDASSQEWPWMSLQVWEAEGGQSWQQGERRAVCARYLPGERSSSPNFFQSWLFFKQLLLESPCHCLVFLQAFFLVALTLLPPVSLWKLVIFCWLLVGGRDDLTDGPHLLATVLLGILSFYSLLHLFDSAWVRPDSLH